MRWTPPEPVHLPRFSPYRQPARLSNPPRHRFEKRTKIDQLKQDRDAAVVQARHDFYNNSRRNYQQNNPNNQQPAQPKSGNGSSSGDGPEYQSK